jgi:Uma2 family endonuclease
MSVIINTRPLSKVEFRQLLERDGRLLELWPDGTVREKPPMSMGHNRLTAVLGAWLETTLGRERVRSGAEAIIEWGDRPAFRPDVVLFTGARWAALVRSVGLGGYANVPPDLAIEIQSPSQSWAELVEKCTWYVRHDVPVAWLVDFQHRQVGVFRPAAAGADVFSELDARPLPLPSGFGEVEVRARDVFALLES